MENKKIRIVILGASEIAFRRFLPALKKDARFEYVGVAYYREQDKDKAGEFQRLFGGQIFTNFESAIKNNNVDAVYVPQPPALHYKYGKMVLEAGKHLFMEKPFTTRQKDTEELLELAKMRHLVAYENYMFKYHNQINKFFELCKSGIVGDISHYETKFCFPLRNTSDFRYSKDLGGGALLDCGGYPIMLSSLLMGDNAILLPGRPLYENQFEVDMHGSGRMLSSNKMIWCDFYFGMNDEYSCYVKAIGAKGILVAPRIFTAPADFDVTFERYDKQNNLLETIEVGIDDAFLKSIDNFYQSIFNDNVKESNYSIIKKQSYFIDMMQKGQK